MKKHTWILLAGLALLIAVALARVRAVHEARSQAAQASSADAVANAPRTATQIKPGKEPELARATRDASIRQLVRNLKVAVAKGDENTERALREGLAKYGDDARTIMDQEGVR